MTMFKPLHRMPLLLFLIAASVQAGDPPKAFDVVPMFKTTSSWDGTPLHYPEGQAELTGLEIAMPPGAETGWHTHPAPSFGVVLEGEWTVYLADGRSKLLRKGDTMVEVVDRPHNGRNTGKTVAKLLVFYAGASGQTLSEKVAAPVLP